MFSLSLVAVSTLFLGAHAIAPSNIMRRSGALTSLKYTGVGGSGSYPQVTNMLPGAWPSCDVSTPCVQTTKEVSGPLAPFDDELTIAFRGPLNLYNISVYQPVNSSSATWTKSSSWTPGEEAHNLVFMNNMGGGASGEFTMCGGMSQSYANGTWTGSAAAPTTGSGTFLPETMEINIMNALPCNDTLACDGFWRGTANHGWAGSKMFVMTFDMPPSENAANVPAVWALNAQVVRAAQYGCNCRGEGASGGCGELDLLEVLAGEGNSPDNAISEIYSFKGATGSGASSFARPATPSTYAAVFDEQSGSILIQELTEWDYTQNAVTRSLVDGYLATTGLTTVPFNTNTRRADRRSIMAAHKRHPHH